MISISNYDPKIHLLYIKHIQIYIFRECAVQMHQNMKINGHPNAYALTKPTDSLNWNVRVYIHIYWSCIHTDTRTHN